MFVALQFSINNPSYKIESKSRKSHKNELKNPFWFVVGENVYFGPIHSSSVWRIFVRALVFENSRLCRDCKRHKTKVWSFGLYGNFDSHWSCWYTMELDRNVLHKFKFYFADFVDRQPTLTFLLWPFYLTCYSIRVPQSEVLHNSAC